VRSYDQFCAVARALDVVGDRWTLLIVRELLITDGARYTDLQHGLPGIATNLLAERLRQLEENGIVTREAAPPPIATTLFRLTARGRELRPVLGALGLWGRPLLDDTPKGAAFRGHWLALPLESLLTDHAPERPPVTIAVHTGEQPITVSVDGEVRVRAGVSPAPDATITGTPDLVVGLFTGEFDLKTAASRGLKFDGDIDALRRVQPAASSRA
jgi:DNA-binding HxlR family transcriptional regulator